MLMHSLGISDSEISQVLSLASSAYLKISVTVQLRYLILRYTAFAMKPINILTYYELKEVLLE